MTTNGRFWWCVHNLIAHPLYILAPPVGRRLHAYSDDRLREADPHYERFSELARNDHRAEVSHASCCQCKARVAELEAERESLPEAIARHKTCRCGKALGAGTVGWRHKRLPALLVMCEACAHLPLPPDYTLEQLRADLQQANARLTALVGAQLAALRMAVSSCQHYFKDDNEEVYAADTLLEIEKALTPFLDDETGAQTLAEREQLQAENARLTAEVEGAKTYRPLAEYHEDMGDVLWWFLPVEEPPWVGTPLNSDWPGYHTHFTRIVMPDEDRLPNSGVR